MFSKQRVQHTRIREPIYGKDEISSPAIFYQDTKCSFLLKLFFLHDENLLLKGQVVLLDSEWALNSEKVNTSWTLQFCGRDCEISELFFSLGIA